MTSTSPQRWALLLRGVNVGGVTLRSADLRARLAQAGFEDVRTVLASGNALVTAAGSEAEIAQRAVTAISGPQGRTVPVLCRRQDELAAAAGACPFDADDPDQHAYLVFTANEDDAAQLAQDARAAVGQGGDIGEDVVIGDRVLYWSCPRGSSLQSTVAKAIERSSRQVVTTTRNLRTIRRLLTD